MKVLRKATETSKQPTGNIQRSQPLKEYPNGQQTKEKEQSLVIRKMKIEFIANATSLRKDRYY